MKHNDSPTEPVTERFVEQRHANDCWNACVASLFGLPYEAVADMPVADGSDQRWRRMWTEWFRERGFTWWDRPMDEDGRYIGFGELTIACGKSPRTDGDHCVLMRDGEVVWDPHPQRDMGIGPLSTVVYLIPLDPAQAHADANAEIERRLDEANAFGFREGARRANAEIERLRAALEIISTPDGRGRRCRVIHGGARPGYTCLDSLADAADSTQRYGDDYRAAILSGKHLCVGCRAVQALSATPQPDADQ